MPCNDILPGAENARCPPRRGGKDVRRARSALVLYTEASRERLRAANPHAKYAEVTRLASAEWKALGLSARADWEKAAVDDKLRFERERAAADAAAGGAAGGAAGSAAAGGPVTGLASSILSGQLPVGPGSPMLRSGGGGAGLQPPSSGARRTQRRIVVSSSDDDSSDEEDAAGGREPGGSEGAEEASPPAAALAPRGKDDGRAAGKEEEEEEKAQQEEESAVDDLARLVAAAGLGDAPAAQGQEGAAAALRQEGLEAAEEQEGLPAAAAARACRMVGTRSPARARKLAQQAPLAQSPEEEPPPLPTGPPPRAPPPRAPPPSLPPPSLPPPSGLPAVGSSPAGAGETRLAAAREGGGGATWWLEAGETAPAGPPALCGGASAGTRRAGASEALEAGGGGGAGKSVIRWADITLGEELGAGGFGVVYAAEWSHDAVAVKRIRPELVDSHGDEARAEFRHELELLCSLRHRHIVQCYGGDAARELFIVTELMERGSLEDCLRAHPAEFRWERLGRRVLLDTAKGLLYLHGRGLVHFDVKPLNILVSAHNVAKLSDVGLTKKLNNTLTRPGGWTPAYAAPEILARQGANETSDIYSFGLVVWQEQPLPRTAHST